MLWELLKDIIVPLMLQRTESWILKTREKERCERVQYEVLKEGYDGYIRERFGNMRSLMERVPQGIFKTFVDIKKMEDERLTKAVYRETMNEDIGGALRELGCVSGFKRAKSKLRIRMTGK